MAHLGHSFGMLCAVRGSAPDTPQGAEPPAPPLRTFHVPICSAHVPPIYGPGEASTGEVCRFRECLSVCHPDD